MRNKIILVSVFALLILSACKTTKPVVNKNVRAISQSVYVVRNVLTNQPEFTTANVSKMTLELNMTNRKVNVSASCKIRKDSAIFASFHVFGFEVFKAELMPDSIKLFDKMNRRYFVTDYSYFSNRFGVDVDFYSLQSLFAAQFFCIGQREIHSDKCTFVSLPDGQKRLDYESENMLQSTQLSALDIIEQVILKAKAGDYQLQTTYTDYTKVNGINFPQKIGMLATGANTKASCDFSILKVEFNTNLKFQGTSPERYTRGDIDQILKK